MNAGHFEGLSSDDREKINKLLREYKEGSGYLNAYQASKELAKLSLSPLLPSGHQIKVALLSSFTIDNLIPFLQLEALDAGIYADIYVGGINQFQFLLRNKSSDLFEFQPEIVFLAAGPESFAGINPIPSQLDMEEALASLLELVDGFKKTSKGLLVLHNFALPTELIGGVDFPGEYQAIVWFNQEVSRRFQDDPQVMVIDLMRLLSFVGSRQAADPRLKVMAGMEFSEEFAALLAKKYVRYLLAFKGISKKCLVLDLDDTLWGGVLGEAGKEGILLSNHGAGLPYYEFQRALLHLQKRGVILAINSKNDEAFALDIIKSHPHMILRREHFSSVKINWSDKVENLKAMAHELNLGLDSFVFLDDNPVERERVRHFLPVVTVPELPADPNEYKWFLDSLGVFEKLHVTEEDKKRASSYESRKHRETLKSTASSYEEFLRGLNTELTIGRAREKDIPRLSQMCQKTNQFNLTTKRYTEIELKTALEDRTRGIYTLSVKDRFDDSGLVGMAIIEDRAPEWRIETLLVSCRVLGRSIEESFLKEILIKARSAGISTVIGMYKSTPKNGLCAHFYQKAGFERVEPDSDELWRIDPSQTNLTREPYFIYGKESVAEEA
jgi:FkbH-like protein